MPAPPVGDGAQVPVGVPGRMSTQSTLALTLAGADEPADLAAYLERLLRFDRAAAVRVVGTGDAVGVYGQPPFHVLTLRTWRLAEPAGAARDRDTAALDVTVS